MKMNFKIFKQLKNPVDVQEVDGNVVEIHYMNDTEYLAKYAGQGYFFVWTSDGESYKLLVEKGYYETLDELFLPEVNKMQINLYKNLAKSRKNIFLGLFLPIVLLVIAAIAVTYFVEQFNDYQIHVLIGGLVLLLLVNIFQSSMIRKRVDKLRNGYFFDLERFLGEEKLQELVVKQREYHEQYFDFDEEVEEPQEGEILETGEVEEQPVVPAWVGDKQEEVVEEEFEEVEEVEEVEEEVIEEEPEEVLEVEEELDLTDELNLNVLNKSELKDFVKDRKISGFSTMNKDELIASLPQKCEKLRVVELQALAKANEIANFSTMRKDELISALKEGPKVVLEETKEEPKEVKQPEEAKEVEVKEVEELEESERTAIVDDSGDVDLNILTMTDLKDFARSRKISGFSTMRKDELVSELPNNIDELRLVELRALARENEIPYFSTMRKDELLVALKLGVFEEKEEDLEPVEEEVVEEISVLHEDGTVNFDLLTLNELKDFARSRKITGFSTMRKDELIAELPTEVKDLKNNELKALAKVKKVSNFSTMRKQELIDAIK